MEPSTRDATKEKWARAAAVIKEEVRRRPVRILASLSADGGLLANLNAICSYKVDEYPAKITLIMAYWSYVRRMARTWRWSSIARGGDETVIVPGCHDTFIRDQRVKSFARHLDATLSPPMITVGRIDLHIRRDYG